MNPYDQLSAICDRLEAENKRLREEGDHYLAWASEAMATLHVAHLSRGIPVTTFADCDQAICQRYASFRGWHRLSTDDETRQQSSTEEENDG